ncbi:MAG: hypothetical protein ABJA86_11540 [Nocardioidaceae bacterium]
MYSPDDSTNALVFWATSALTSAERILSEADFSPWSSSRKHGQSGLVRRADAALMLLALRNVLSAAEWSASDLREHAEDIDDTIATFRHLLPNLVNARDVLEHFDEYALGVGRFQRGSPEMFYFDLVEGAEEPTVVVGRFTLSVLHAPDACRWLVISLLARVPLPPEHVDRAEQLLNEVLSEVEASERSETPE